MKANNSLRINMRRALESISFFSSVMVQLIRVCHNESLLFKNQPFSSEEEAWILIILIIELPLVLRVSATNNLSICFLGYVYLFIVFNFGFGIINFAKVYIFISYKQFLVQQVYIWFQWYQYLIKILAKNVQSNIKLAVSKNSYEFFMI